MWGGREGEGAVVGHGQRRTGAEKIGGSTPNFQSDGIYSPTNLTKTIS